VLCDCENAVRCVLDATLDRGSGRYKRANQQNPRGELMSAALVAIERRGFYLLGKQISSVSAIGPRSAFAVHTLAIRRKRRCKAGLRTSATNCMQSDAKRRHSKSSFRDLFESRTAHHLKYRGLTIAWGRWFCRWSMPRIKEDKSSTVSAA
jgi:hypothetical protein